MRIPSWLVALMGFGALVLMTGICSVVSYGAVRGVVVDLWASGVEVNSPAQIWQALSNPQAQRDATATPAVVAVQTTPTITPIVINPFATPTPTQETVANALATPAPTDTVGETPAPIVATPDPRADYTWNDPRQIRILLMGIDERKGFTTDRAYRTDTMILLNVDPVRKTAGLISFPRDLWVNIPNFTPGRINTANYIGDNAAYPNGGGARLAMETITANFGVSVNRYIRVNFTLFESVVDILAPNGVQVCIDQEIYDPKYPDEGFGTLEVRFSAGCQRLNAEKMLQFARTRATQGGDFDRAKRQQQALDAIRAEVLSAGGIANFVTQIPALWQELSDNYKTNLTLEEIISLGFLMGDIPRENITFAVVDNNYVDLGKAPDGADVLFPQTGRIADLIQRVLYPQIQVTQADLLARARQENAQIQVFNGTDTVGLAGKTQEWLVGKGVTVAGLGNATAHGGAPTVIKDYGNNRWTAQWLASVLGLSPDRIQPGTDGLATSGIVIVVGRDIEGIISR
jgi:LCP family protein required for cell wall assembly